VTARNRKSKKRRRKYDRKVIDIRRVAKTRAGARRLRFSSMVVVGDKKGKVGVAIGRASDTRSSIDKAARKAEKVMTKIDLIGDTIPHKIVHKYGAAEVMLKPAKPGTGVIASNAIRSIMELAGVRDVLSKQLGSQNPITNAYCVFEALKELDKTRIVKKMRQRKQKQSAKKSRSKKKSKAKKNNVQGKNKKDKRKSQNTKKKQQSKSNAKKNSKTKKNKQAKKSEKDQKSKRKPKKAKNSK
jgi:small subunit ribosomal protein S5